MAFMRFFTLFDYRDAMRCMSLWLYDFAWPHGSYYGLSLFFALFESPSIAVLHGILGEPPCRALLARRQGAEGADRIREEDPREPGRALRSRPYNTQNTL